MGGISNYSPLFMNRMGGIGGNSPPPAGGGIIKSVHTLYNAFFKMSGILSYSTHLLNLMGGIGGNLN